MAASFVLVDNITHSTTGTPVSSAMFVDRQTCGLKGYVAVFYYYSPFFALRATGYDRNTCQYMEISG